MQRTKSCRRRLPHPEKLTIVGLRTVRDGCRERGSLLFKASGTNEGRFFGAAEGVASPTSHSDCVPTPLRLSQKGIGWDFQHLGPLLGRHPAQREPNRVGCLRPKLETVFSKYPPSTHAEPIHNVCLEIFNKTMS